ncbi:urea ABC transporter ATP-binding protein UrtD [Marivita sp.]|uniref:urea ABC transporter ATP-binding protein UrtD n=1 Tax=Marivita sp. TaxID=2003365 RepID=UPI0025C1F54E|nr:urea ABC transporter ATP-binding protein UrtD [Marivita sp.]
MSILELQGVSKKFGDFPAVNEFSLSVDQGELRCLLGPNGAGKSTCMDLITGRQKTSGGKVFFKGEDITDNSEHKIVRSGIGRKFQVPAVFPHLSVEQNLEVAFAKGRGPFAAMGVFRRTLGHSNRFDEIIEMIGLSRRLEDLAGLLSHGETQWLEIGMVLMQDPDLLLMDEPTAGMTEQETLKTSEIFNRLKGSHTLIVVEHDMSFVRQIADVVTVMHMGGFLAQRTITEIEANPEVRDVYLGEEGDH